MKETFPFGLRVAVSRIREGGVFRRLCGRFVAGGYRSYIAKSAGARDWSQVEICSGAYISGNTFFQVNSLGGAKKIRIGRGVFVGGGCYFSAGEMISVGDDCLIGANCSFLGAGHSAADPMRAYASAPVVSYGPMILGTNVWVGVGSLVLGNVSIGFGAIVGAGTHIRKSLPPLCMAVGIPATIIKTYDLQQRAWMAVPDQPEARREHLHRHVSSVPTEQEYVAALASSR